MSLYTIRFGSPTALTPYVGRIVIDVRKRAVTPSIRCTADTNEALPFLTRPDAERAATLLRALFEKQAGQFRVVPLKRRTK